MSCSWPGWSNHFQWLCTDPPEFQVRWSTSTTCRRFSKRSGLGDGTTPAAASVFRQRFFGSMEPGDAEFFSALISDSGSPFSPFSPFCRCRSVRLLGFPDSPYWIDDECGLNSLGLLDDGRPGPADFIGPADDSQPAPWPAGCRMALDTRTGAANDAACLSARLPACPGSFPGFPGYVQGIFNLTGVANELFVARVEQPYSNGIALIHPSCNHRPRNLQPRQHLDQDLRLLRRHVPRPGELEVSP